MIRVSDFGFRISLLLLSLLLLTTLTSPLHARTILLNEADADDMGALTANAPHETWACYDNTIGDFNATIVDVTNNCSFLIRFPLDQIPKGQRITKAELILPLAYAWDRDQRLYVWRVLPDWGTGVCQLYRINDGTQRLPWAVPGARSNAADRAAAPTCIVNARTGGDLALNVTPDIELWYAGLAPNHGWMLSVEDEGAMLRFNAPAWTGARPAPGAPANPGTPLSLQWRLRITYEPR